MPRKPKNYIGIILLFVFAYSGCGGMFFYPQKQLVSSPADFALRYHDVWIPSSDGKKLHGWYLPAQQVEQVGLREYRSSADTPKGTIVHLHGNAQNMSTHIFNVHWLPKSGYDVLTFDYRGFGQSQGRASLPEVVEDAKAAIRYAYSIDRKNAPCTIVLGQSIGGALAAIAVSDLQDELAIQALVLDSAFADFAGIAKTVISKSWLFFPLVPIVQFLIPSVESPVAALSKLSGVPLLIVHGENDTIVPIVNADELYASYRGEKEYWRITEGGHIDALSRANVREQLLSYLEEQCARGISLASQESISNAPNL